jgi:hypothetical protein
MPPERRVFDRDSGALFDYAVLRFDKDGSFNDYLGQEGIGGTPFPYILGLFVTPNDDCVVISVIPNAWLVHWFDSRGFLRSSLKILRDSLPQPPNEENLLASLDRIVPDTTGRAAIFKIDYSREIVDRQTKSHSGIEYASSWIYRMDLVKGVISDRWELPAIQLNGKKPEDGGAPKYVLVPQFLGVAGDRFFFVNIDDESKTSISIFNRNTNGLQRYSIEIAPEELYFSTMALSPEGVISALLGTKYEARIVWWRFDKIIGLSAGSN